jgi:hypothetical protein
VSAAWPEKVCGLLATCAGSHGGHGGALWRETGSWPSPTREESVSWLRRCSRMLRSRGREQRGWGGRSEMNSIGVFGRRKMSAAGALKRTSRRGRGRPRRAMTWPASSCVAVGHARGSARSAAGGTEEPVIRITVASPIQPILWFCEIRPNFELKTKFHQNKSYSEFYKLQIFFWWPKPILGGKWRIWQNSLNFKSQIGEIPIFELGQIRISKITFNFSKQLEKLPTWKLFNFLSSTTLMLVTFQNSK